MALIEFQNNTAPYLNADNLNNNFSYTVPIGSVLDFAGTTAPDGFLICNGSAVSRITYADLFTVIGTTYGVGDGSTTFNLPNSQGKIGVGLDSNDTDFNTLGKTGGSKELQEHSHDYARGVQYVTSNGYLSYNASSNYGNADNTTAPAGTGNSGNLQPYIVFNKIIKY